MSDYELPDCAVEDDERCEEQVKLEVITPALEKAGWPKKQLRMEYLTPGRMILDNTSCRRDTRRRKVDYLLISRGGKGLAVVEAKKERYPDSHGIQQAVSYAQMLRVPFAYSTSGHMFHEQDLITGKIRDIPLNEFPSEDDLWKRFTEEKELPLESSLSEPFFTELNGKVPRYYQRVAVNCILEAIESGKKRVLAVMATGTGKTFVCMQVIHKLLAHNPNAKILFLEDRNGLVDQTMANDFKHFQNSMTKIQKKTLNSAYSIHMSLYQQLVDDSKPSQPYTQFKPDYFDYVFVDECHRGSAKEDSEWRQILDYFESAVQIGVTATPKEDREASTTEYFGKSVYTYSYRQGVEDGFLAPFVAYDDTSNIDWHWEPGMEVEDIDGNPVEGPFDFRDYDRRVIVPDRNRMVAERVVEWLSENGWMCKTIVFCETEEHAARIRDYIKELVPEQVAKNPNYCVRITASDKEGIKQLENFNDRFSAYPVIATTSELLTTGHDCFMTKLIVIDKLVGSKTQFKQILGRGSRMDEKLGKTHFTVIDFRHATSLLDKDWDGDVEPYEESGRHEVIHVEVPPRPERPQYEKIVIKTPIPVEIEQEIIKVYGNGKMTFENLVDYSKKKLLGYCPNLSDFLATWNSENRKDVIIGELERKGVLIDEILDRRGRPDIDVFDILIELAYGNIPLTKTQRVDNVVNSDQFNQYGGTAREILKTLLEVYATRPDEEIGNMQLLTLDEFEQFGTPVQIMKAFGGKEKYLDAVYSIQKLLYAEV